MVSGRLRRHRRVELAQAAGGGVARVLERGLPAASMLRLEPLEVGHGQKDLAAHLQQPRPALARSRSGTAPMVRTWAVTSSPTLPSPRVAPRVRTPSS
jgi:hypothetical protein